MSKQLIRSFNGYQQLYRDDRTGIAWIEDGSSGCGVSIHPNIHASGSVSGMKAQGFWDKNDRTVRSHGFIYNIDRIVYCWEADIGNNMYALEKIVRDECRCTACLERKIKEKRKKDDENHMELR